LDTSAFPGAKLEAMAGEPAEVLSRLETTGVRHVYVDGGATIQAFLRAGLVDRLIVTDVPVLIGEGIPLFGRLAQDVRLRHVRTKTLRGGLVQSEYLAER
jgi:dihydrofolate reductase